ncbi:lysine--tRNA ligase [Nanchangia anserum]|uniref:Lysine--tRNA ligase n=1 Tax=Nanchangia anserum TaxID=2692125 RepID=A0A8I0GD94_9ACTO|nr:lysine--tRNA ligase [Nanchangia anserum]MBD3690025.1 lysine--tRNA ligase [Nanchangia anserum]QOX82560.1 lysine--tRNA ligase [Nanchangia anserum]
MRVRADKRAGLLEAGTSPYPVSLPITHTISQVREAYAQLAPGEETDDIVGVAGRVMFVRNTGKLCFATLQQGDGTRIQAMFSAKDVGTESLADFKSLVDLGDHLFVHGRVISSKRGELSVWALPGEDAPAWQLASKALRPLPKTFTDAEGNEHALSEEMRVRSRHLDMIMRPAARQMVRTRYEVVKSLRRFLDDQGFIEVETPMLQTLHGGAAARPFVTHMNAYDMDLYLRIAPELFLKRCVVGGIDKVFEINRNFRNEGADSSHSPEFTMLEAYQTYGTYDTIAALTRGFIQQAARDVFGSEVVTLADGSSYDMSGQWRELDLYGCLSEKVGEEITPATPRERLDAIAERCGVEYDPKIIDGKLVETLFEELVGDDLWEPTFVRNYPVDTSPLVRQHRSREGVVEKWDLYVRGFELATGYSELVDPVIQRERFVEQSLLAAGGDPEAMQVDEDFLAAMEAGMPPTGGMGMGLDRLLMAFTGLGIRETITFPLVKPTD